MENGSCDVIKLGGGADIKPIIEEKPSLDELCHYGMPRRSGRYPYGSGEKWGKVNAEKIRSDGGRIAAGTKLGRLTANEKEDHKGRIYVTDKNSGSIVDQEMTDMYKNYIRTQKFNNASPEERKEMIQKYSRYGQIPLFEMDMTTKVDLILPSMKEKGEVFAKKFLASEKAQWQIAEAYDAEKEGKTDWSKYSKQEKRDILADTKDALERAAMVYKKNGFELDDDGPYTSADSIKSGAMYDGYRIFIASLNDRKVMNVYKAELGKKGYNAISDDYDEMDVKGASVNKMLERYDELNRTTSVFSKLTQKGREKIAERNEIRDIIKEPLSQKKKTGGRLTENKELRKRFTGGGIVIFERSGTLEVNQIIRIGEDD